MSIEIFAAANRHRPIAGPVRVSVIGDSIMSDAISSSFGWLNWGMLTWLRRYLGDRIDLPLSRVYASAGKTVAQVRAEQYPSALADVSQIVIDNSGTNSIGGDTAAILADKMAMYDGLRTAGKTVLIIGIRAHRAPSAYTADQAKQVGYINNALRRYAEQNANVLYWLPDPHIIDWATGETLSEFFRDGIHDNQSSADVQGRALAGFLSPLLPAVDSAFVGLGDVYDQTINPTGNMLTNGLLAGSGGSNVNGASGTPPTSWSAVRSSSGSTTTLAASKEADPVFSTLSRAVLTLGGTGDGGLYTLQQLVTLPAGVVAGDVLELSAAVDAATTEPLLSVLAQIRYRDAGQAAVSGGDVYDGYYSSGNGALPGGRSFAGILKARLAVPANAVYATVYLGGSSINNAADVDAVLKFSRASLRKVI